MKVYIGPYLNFFGVYQLFDLLRFIGVDKNRRHDMATAFNEKCPWVSQVLNWVHSKRTRKINIKTHRYDHWSADHTFSLIIPPVLKDLQKAKNSFGFIDDEDVPEELRSTNSPPKEHEFDWDTLAKDRYDWFLNELVWAFEAHIHEDDVEFDDEPVLDFDKVFGELMEGKSISFAPYATVKRDAHFKRMNHAFKLFGKYYRTLWD